MLDTEHTYVIRLGLGGILPPASHPFYDRISAEEQDALLNRVQVEIDGTPILLARQHFYESAPEGWVFGGRSVKDCRFSGLIESWDRGPLTKAPVLKTGSRFVLRMPQVIGEKRQEISSVDLPPMIGKLYFRKTIPDNFVWGIVMKTGETLETAADELITGSGIVLDLVLNNEQRETASIGKGWFLVRDGAVMPWASVETPSDASQDYAEFSGLVLSQPTPFGGAGKIGTNGIVRMRVAFGVRPVGTAEPLLVAGQTGRGNFLIVEYLAENRVRFGWEIWGGRILWSQPREALPGVWQKIELRISGLMSHEHRGASVGPLLMKWNQSSFWECEARCYSSETEDIYIGHNPIGGTSCGSAFSGRIEVFQ